MKLNVSYPATGCQKLFDIDDEKKVRIFYDKRMGQEVEVDSHEARCPDEHARAAPAVGWTLVLPTTSHG